MTRGLNDPLTAIAVNLCHVMAGFVPAFDPNRDATGAKMIIDCPSCATRYDIPPSRLAAQNARMNCSACGKAWIESGSIAVVDAPVRDLPAVIDYDAPSEREIERLVEASRVAREDFAARKRARSRNLRGWGALAASLLLPIGVAFAFPEEIVRVAPASARLYEAAGISVNIYGLELRNVEQQHLIVDGQRMLAVKGLVVNVSGEDRKVPSLRFGLRERMARKSITGRQVQARGRCEPARSTISSRASPRRPKMVKSWKSALRALTKSAQIPFHDNPHN